MADIYDLLAELGDGAANARHASDLEDALELAQPVTCDLKESEPFCE